MKYDIDEFSYGVELEYGNIFRFCKLPTGAVWNSQDNTISSSTGIGNDPEGLLYKFGGEINTKPTFTVEEQIKHIEKINNTLYPNPLVNYRTNLHIHVRVPNLHENLEDCKRLLFYISKYQKQAFKIVEKIPVTDKLKVKGDRYKWELKREKRRHVSHQYCMPKQRVDEMMNSKTVKEFFEAHAPLTDKGRMWHFSPRAGINLRQLWLETNTIEFRHFPGTIDLYEMESCVKWCGEFLNAALNTPIKTPLDIYKSFKYKFPEFGIYEYETEQVYQWTNLANNSRKEVQKRLEALRNEIDIDNIQETKSIDVYNIMLKLKGKV